MSNFFSRSTLFAFGSLIVITTLVVGGAYAFNSLAPTPTATPTLTSTTKPANTPTTQPSNTPTATLTFTPTLTLTATKPPTPTSTNTATLILPTFTSTFTATPDVLNASISGCDVTNRKIEVKGLAASAKVGMTVKLPSGVTYTLQSVSNDGHGWLANVSADAIKANCPATATPKPGSSGGGSSGGTGSSGGSSQPPPIFIPPTDEPEG